MQITFENNIQELDKRPPTKCTLKSFLPILNSSLSLLHIYDQVLSHFSRVQLFVTPTDLSLPGFSVHGILQARILESGTGEPGGLPSIGSHRVGHN